MKEEYCTKCGEKLIVRYLDYVPWYMKLFGAVERNPFNGELNKPEERICPKSKMFNFDHTKVLSIKRY